MFKKLAKHLYKEINKKAKNANVQTGVITGVLPNENYQVRIAGNNAVINNAKSLVRNSTFTVGQKIVVGNIYGRNEDWYIFGDTKVKLDDALLGEAEIEDDKPITEEDVEQSLNPEVNSKWVKLKNNIEYNPDGSVKLHYLTVEGPNTVYSGTSVALFAGNVRSDNLADYSYIGSIDFDQNSWYVLFSSEGNWFPPGTFYFIGIPAWDDRDSFYETHHDYTLQDFYTKGYSSNILKVEVTGTVILQDWYAKSITANRPFYTLPSLDYIFQYLGGPFILFDSQYKIVKSFEFCDRGGQGQYEGNRLYIVDGMVINVSNGLLRFNMNKRFQESDVIENGREYYYSMQGTYAYSSTGVRGLYLEQFKTENGEFENYYNTFWWLEDNLIIIDREVYDFSTNIADEMYQATGNITYKYRTVYNNKEDLIVQWRHNPQDSKYNGMNVFYTDFNITGDKKIDFDMLRADGKKEMFSIADDTISFIGVVDI